MKFTYRIHRASKHPVDVKAVFEGAEVSATITEMQVEMVDDSGQHGTLTLHFRVPSEVAEAEALFVEGESVTLEAARAASE